jgi:hypothetical protein
MVLSEAELIPQGTKRGNQLHSLHATRCQSSNEERHCIQHFVANASDELEVIAPNHQWPSWLANGLQRTLLAFGVSTTITIASPSSSAHRLHYLYEAR